VADLLGKHEETIKR